MCLGKPASGDVVKCYVFVPTVLGGWCVDCLALMLGIIFRRLVACWPYSRWYVRDSVEKK